MFRRISKPKTDLIELNFEGQPIYAQPGETVAAALLAGGINEFRATPEKGSERGPFCMMGVCFDCLVVIDEQPNQQACQVFVEPGMKVRRQRGVAEVVLADGGIVDGL